MECKFDRKLTESEQKLEELIDTLWNVNKGVEMMGSAAAGINRYIMECKWMIQSQFSLCDIELIDTLWNVNMY